MTKKAKRILKKDNVKLEGRFHLDLAKAGSSRDGPKQRSAASSAPQARIVESHPEFAVIEVICSCGTGTLLRCEYAGAQAPEGPQKQNSTLETSNKVPDQAK
jgi:hypothetical protein